VDPAGGALAQTPYSWLGAGITADLPKNSTPLLLPSVHQFFRNVSPVHKSVSSVQLHYIRMLLSETCTSQAYNFRQVYLIARVRTEINFVKVLDAHQYFRCLI